MRAVTLQIANSIFFLFSKWLSLFYFFLFFVHTSKYLIDNLYVRLVYAEFPTDKMFATNSNVHQDIMEKILTKKTFVFFFVDVAFSFQILNAILTDLTMGISEIPMLFLEFCVCVCVEKPFGLSEQFVSRDSDKLAKTLNLVEIYHFRHNGSRWLQPAWM